MRTGTLSVVFLAVITATSVQAQQLRIGVYGDDVNAECEFVLTATPPIGYAHVIVKNSVQFKTIRFRAPVPACNGLVYVGESVPDGVAFGDSQTGIEITRNACTSGNDIEVLTITYLLPEAGAEECQWVVEPYPGDATIELTDCEGYFAKGASNYAGWMNGLGTCGLIGEDNFIGPYRPDPQDGAASVPVNVLLDWVGPANTIYFADHPFDIPIPGHDHLVDDLIFEPDFINGIVTPPRPFDPGPLAPNTTYYWRMGNFCYGCVHGQGAVSDDWSFTTEGTVTTKTSTWGAIKALHRR